MEPGAHFIRGTAAGIPRRCLVHVPPGTKRDRPWPVVLMLHGTGGTARWTLQETGWAATADREGFLLVLPEGLPRDPGRRPHWQRNPQHWSATRPADLEFLQWVLDQLEGEWAADPARLYVTGFSSGAEMTFAMARALGRRLAAIAPVAGHCPPDLGLLAWPVPTLYLVGTADPLMPLDGGVVVSPWGGTLVRPPIRDTLARWAAALGCGAADVVLESAEVEIERYACRPGAELLVYRIAGLGHHWPGGRGQWAEALAGPHANHVRAHDVIWHFFQQHRRRLP